MYGQKLKQVLKSRNITQKELSDLINIPPTTINGWTKKSYPLLENIEKVCKALNMPLWRFFLDNPAEIASHPINQLDEIDLEILTAIKNLDKKTRDQVLYAFRDILQALVEAKEHS
ncbi:MAG TPA: helix-turn-helix transcriptional regulator [Spirochaetota bacterium]|nr:helix-turn-helix transcriptional regulator [Spirochaetota bacterium]